jgi:hypothetical protein
MCLVLGSTLEICKYSKIRNPKGFWSQAFWIRGAQPVLRTKTGLPQRTAFGVTVFFFFFFVASQRKAFGRNHFNVAFLGRNHFNVAFLNPGDLMIVS